MKSYILTEREKEIIRKYLETGEKAKSIYVYIHRAKRYYPQLAADVEMMKMLLDREFK